MAETQTPNFHWIKPDVGGDSTVWGNVLNTTFDAVDSVVWSNQQGIMPIGSVVMFSGSVAPTNWMDCNGAVYLDTDVPALAAVIKASGFAGFPGSDATHTAVPDLRGKFPIGRDSVSWTRGLTGGEANHTLLMAEMPAHSHTATQGTHTHAATIGTHSHPITDVAHTHGVNQWAHSHAIATGGHNHSISTGSHAHGLDHLVLSNTGGGNASAGAGWAFVSANTVTVGDLGGSTSTAGNLGGNTDAQTSAISLVAAGSGLSTTQAASPGAITVPSVSAGAITVTSQGSGATHNNMPPYLCVGFIIRYR
jgi:microcystin-dependent protein